MTATGRVRGKWAKMIMAITVMGTQRNIPGIPQIEPHTASETRVAKGLMLSEDPIIIGSRKLPMKTWMTARLGVTMRKGTTVSNWTSARSAGKRMPSSEPMVGM